MHYCSFTGKKISTRKNFTYLFNHDGEDVNEFLDELDVIFAQFRHILFGSGICTSRRRLYNRRDRWCQL